MMPFLSKRKYRFSMRFVSFLVILMFSASLITPPPIHAQSLLNLPAPGTMISLSSDFVPPTILGIKIFPDNPLRFDFIIETGDSKLNSDDFKEESTKLIKYFLASLTVPDDDLWVNLSPYEAGRIIPEKFGSTEMGRDLLAQDYILKQLTASLMYPEKDLGNKFWERVYARAGELYGNTEIPVNTFKKVWIVPEKAVVYEDGEMAFVVESHLKVMLEEDYLALKENLKKAEVDNQLNLQDVKQMSDISSNVVRDVILPEIEKEVNGGKNFAALRQIYNSMILATWFKRNLQESILGKVYVGQNKIEGVDVEDKTVKEKIYQQYLEAFKKGVFDLIKEDYDPTKQQVISRKYFSGGFNLQGKELANVLDESGTLPQVRNRANGKDLQTVSAFLREAHEQYHKDGNLGDVIESIAVELGIEKKAGKYDLIQAIKNRGGGISLVNGGQLRIEKEGDFEILVVIDSRLGKDHAGRGTFQLAVYAQNDDKAKHELKELKEWVSFAQYGLSIVSEAEIKDGQLGIKLNEWANGLKNGIRDSTLSNEELLRRQNLMIEKYDEFHRAGLIAEGNVVEAAKYEYTPKLTAPQDNFDFIISSEGRVLSGWNIRVPEVVVPAELFGTFEESIKAGRLFVNGFLTQINQDEVIQALSNIAGKRLSMGALEKEIEVSFHDSGTHKNVFKVVMHLNNGESFVIKLALKRGDISEQEIETLSVISELTSDVPRFGGAYAYGGNNFYLEEFISGSTVQQLKKEGFLTVEIRQKSVESILRIAALLKQLGEASPMIKDIHRNNIMIRPGDELETVLIDLGDKRIKIEEALIRLINFYGYHGEEKGNNEFIYQSYLNVFGLEEGIRILRETTKRLKDNQQYDELLGKEIGATSDKKRRLREDREEPALTQEEIQQTVREVEGFIGRKMAENNVKIFDPWEEYIKASPPWKPKKRPMVKTRGVVSHRMVDMENQSPEESDEDLADTRRMQMEMQRLKVTYGTADHTMPGYQMVKTIFDRLLDQVNQLGYAVNKSEYSLDVLNTETPNAFIFPRVKQAFITRSLLQRISNYSKNHQKPLTEDMIAFILAHEIAHTLLGSYEAQPDAQDISSLALGTYLEQGVEATAKHAFSFFQEYRSDQLGLRLMDTAGFNVNEGAVALDMLIRLEAEYKQKQPSELGILAGFSYPSILDTHPHTDRRLNAVRELIANRPWINDEKPLTTILTDHYEALLRETPYEIMLKEFEMSLSDGKNSEFRDKLKEDSETYDAYNENIIYFLINRDRFFEEIKEAIARKSIRDIETLLYAYLPVAVNFSLNLSSLRDYADFNFLRYSVIRSYKIWYVEQLIDTSPEFRTKMAEYVRKEKINKDITARLKLYLDRVILGEKFINDHPSWQLFTKHVLVDWQNVINDTYLSSEGPILFTSWGDLRKSGQELKDLLEDPIYNRLVLDYQRAAAMATPLFDEMPMGLEREILEWLAFYSYIPTKEGRSRLDHIFENLKDPEVIIRVMSKISLKNFNLPQINEIVDGPISRFNDLWNNFLVSSYSVLKEGGAFASPQEEFNFAVSVITEDLRNPSFYSPLSAPMDILKSTILNVISGLQTKDEFDAFVSKLFSLPLLDANRLFLSQHDNKFFMSSFIDAAKAKNFMGENLEQDLEFITTIIPEVSSDRDHVLMDLVNNVYWKDMKSAYQTIDPYLKDKKRRQEKIYTKKEIEEQRKRIKTFSDWVHYMVEYVGVTSYRTSSEFLWLVKQFAEDIEDLKKGFNELKAYVEQSESVERNKELKDVLSVLGKEIYLRAIQEGKVGESFKEHAEFIVQWIPPGKERNEMLVQILQKFGKDVSDFLTVRDQFLTDGTAEDILTAIIDRHRDKMKDLYKRVQESLAKYRQSPLGRTQEGEIKPIDITLGAGELTQIKIKAGEIAYAWALEQGFFGGSFGERIKRLIDIFPEYSEARDRHLLHFLEEQKNLSNEDYVMVINVLLSPIDRLALGREAFNRFREAQSGDFNNYDFRLKAILNLFPDYTIERDGLLNDLANELTINEQQIKALQPYFTLNRPTSSRLSVVFTEAGLETYRDLVMVGSPRDKAEFILWFLGLRMKPAIVSAMEEGTGYAVDQIRKSIDSSPAGERMLFLKELLEGPSGIFTSRDRGTERFFLDYLFGLLIKSGNEQTLEMRRLKALYDAIFEYTPLAGKKTKLVLSLLQENLNDASAPQLERAFLNAYGLFGPKGAQFLATRTGMLSEERRKEYLLLTDDVEAINKQAIFETIRLTFGKEPSEIFTEVGERLGSASIKQVHRVKFADGTTAVIKVLRPTVVKEVRSQLETFEKIIKMVESNKELFNLRLPEGMVEELSQSVQQELDFSHEVMNQEQLYQNISQRWAVPNETGFQIFVPKILSEYTKGPIIVEERVSGVRVDQVSSLSGVDANAVKTTLVKELFVQIFEDGFFITEPHNILVDQSGRIGIIDAGSVGRLSSVNRSLLLELMGALFSADRNALTKWLMELKMHTPVDQQRPLAKNEIQKSINHLIDLKKQGRVNVDVLYQVVNEINNLNIRVPQEFYLLLKAFSSLEYIIGELPDKESFIQSLFMQYYLRFSRLADSKVLRPSAEELQNLYDALPEEGESFEGKSITKEDQTISLGKIHERWKIDFIPANARFRKRAMLESKEKEKLSSIIDDVNGLFLELEHKGFLKIISFPNTDRQLVILQSKFRDIKDAREMGLDQKYSDKEKAIFDFMKEIQTNADNKIYWLESATKLQEGAKFTFKKPSDSVGFIAANISLDLYEVSLRDQGDEWFGLDGVKVSSGVKSVETMEDVRMRVANLSKIDSYTPYDDDGEHEARSPDADIDSESKVKTVLNSYFEMYDLELPTSEELDQVVDWLKKHRERALRRWLNVFHFDEELIDDIVSELKTLELTDQDKEELEEYVPEDILNAARGVVDIFLLNNEKQKKRKPKNFSPDSDIAKFIKLAASRLKKSELLSDEEINTLNKSVRFLEENLDLWPVMLNKNDQLSDGGKNFIKCAPVLLGVMPAIFVDMTGAEKEALSEWLTWAKEKGKPLSVQIFFRSKPNTENEYTVLVMNRELVQATAEKVLKMKNSVLYQEFQKAGIYKNRRIDNEESLAEALYALREFDTAFEPFFGVTEKMAEESIRKRQTEQTVYINSRWLAFKLTASQNTQKAIDKIDAVTEVMIDYLREVQLASIDISSLRADPVAKKIKRVLSKITINKNYTGKAPSKNPITGKRKTTEQDTGNKSQMEDPTLRKNSLLTNGSSETKGGIDFNPTLWDIETQGQGGKFNFPDLRTFEGVQINGFTPVIFQILPTNLHLLIGAAFDEIEGGDAAYNQQQISSLPQVVN